MSKPVMVHAEYLATPRQAENCDAMYRQNARRMLLKFAADHDITLGEGIVERKPYEPWGDDDPFVGYWRYTAKAPILSGGVDENGRARTTLDDALVPTPGSQPDSYSQDRRDHPRNYYVRDSHRYLYGTAHE